MVKAKAYGSTAAATSEAAAGPAGENALQEMLSTARRVRMASRSAAEVRNTEQEE